MKKVVLLGTTHPIQRGDNMPGLFKATLLKQCSSHEIQGIAEEIENNAVTVASLLASALKLKYLYADPDWSERVTHGIESDCRWSLIQEFSCKYPGIRAWPKEENEETLPGEVLTEYQRRSAVANRRRERVWLEKIAEFDVWPLLFVCGADHFEPFASLLEESGYDLVKSHANWPN